MFKYENANEKAKDIRTVVDYEWAMFQKVNNVGGRAGCQEDFNTFSIMRSCQFISWDDFTLQSYKKDLEDANRDGRNLVMEKYAWMMETSDPKYFHNVLLQHLPNIDS